MVVVSAAGELRRLFGDTYTRVETVSLNDRVRLFEGDVASFDMIYRKQPAVRTVCGFRARNIAHLPVRVMNETRPNDFEQITDSPLAKLLRRPAVGMTPYSFFFTLIMDMSIYDRSLWVKVYVPGAGLKLVRVPPMNFQPQGDQWQLTSIRVTNGGSYRDFPLSDVLYLEGYTPDRNYGGVPPLETLANTIADEMSSSRYREGLWRNGARMEHVITRPETTRKWTEDAKDRFWKRWNQRYTGAQNAGRTGLLEEGMDIKTVESFSAQAAQYMEGRKFNLEEVARLFYIPPSAIGVLDGASYANMTAQTRQLYRHTFGPDLTWLEQNLLLQLGPEDVSDKLTVYFDLGAKIEASLEEMAPALTTLSGGPVMTPNEARTRLKLADLPEQDELREVSGTIDPAAEDADPEEKPGEGTPPGPDAGSRVTPIRQGQGNPSVYRQREREA